MRRADTLLVLGPLAVLLLFGGACATPAAYYRGKFLEEGVTSEGLNLLLFGWFALPISPLVGLAWFANPLLASGLVAIWRRRFTGAAQFAAAATVLALLPLGHICGFGTWAVRWWPSPAVVLTNEWNEAEIRPGYVFWVAAHGFLMVVALIRRSRGPDAKAEDLEGDFPPDLTPTPSG
ncbi:MAG TPA: hypothetical protein VM597_26815 [Gemmataceae bacterium]|nr:hypothetical protein [Gemmataceae bacterium]